MVVVLKLERCNPWPRRHISISQLLSLWRHSHCDVICNWAGRAHRYRRTDTLPRLIYKDFILTVRISDLNFTGQGCVIGCTEALLARARLLLCTRYTYIIVGVCALSLLYIAAQKNHRCQISRGSVATCLRCGGIDDDDVIYGRPM